MLSCGSESDEKGKNDGSPHAEVTDDRGQKFHRWEVPCMKFSLGVLGREGEGATTGSGHNEVRTRTVQVAHIRKRLIEKV